MAQLPTAPTTGRPCGKVPQLIQMEALECGATSLGMVCAYYGLWVSPEKLRADCERDYFMTAEEALNYGIIDQIYYPRKKNA